MTLSDPTTSRLAFAGVSALTVLTWYALPDAVRSRPTRCIIKAGLLGVTAGGVAMIPQVFPKVRDDLRREPRTDLSGPAVALALGATAVGALATVWFEKAIYAHGERGRARGVRCSHTPAALVLALVAGVAPLVGWTKLTRKATQNRRAA